LNYRKAEEVTRKLIFDLAVKSAIASAIAQFPFLGIVGIRQIFSFIIEKTASLVYEQLSRFVVFSIIDLKNQSDLKAYQEATISLKMAIETPSEHYDHGEHGIIKKEAEIEQAKDEFKKRLANLIRFNI
jgi:hypothetical protein